MGKLIYDGHETTDAKTAKAESNKARCECVCVCACTPQVSVRLPSPRAHTRQIYITKKIAA